MKKNCKSGSVAGAPGNSSPDVRGHRLMGIRLLIAIAFSMLWQAVFASEFEKYQPENSLVAKPAKLILNAKEKREYRTVLRTEASRGANFNGHYRIAQWGCGTNCISWAVIDLSSGKVWMAKKTLESCWPMNATEPPPETIPEWLEFSLSSSLIYAYECDDATGRYTFNRRNVYHWENHAPVPLRTDKVAF